jgi:TPR repeat protein
MKRRNASLATAFLLACGGAPSQPAASSPAAPASTEPPSASASPPDTGGAPAAHPCIDGDVNGCASKCDSGELESCVRLARIYSFGGPGVPVDLAKARDLQVRGCDQSYARACYSLAGTFELGRGNPKDPGRAKALYTKAFGLLTKACDASDGESCAILADMYMIGNVAPKDSSKETALRTRATELRRRACDGGDASECFMSGADLLAAKDAAGAAAYLQKGCDAGDADSCRLLGQMYLEGTGVTKDPSKARALFKKACDAGSADACDSGKKR